MTRNPKHDHPVTKLDKVHYGVGPAPAEVKVLYAGFLKQPVSILSDLKAVKLVRQFPTVCYVIFQVMKLGTKSRIPQRPDLILES